MPQCLAYSHVEDQGLTEDLKAARCSGAAQPWRRGWNLNGKKLSADPAREFLNI